MSTVVHSSKRVPQRTFVYLLAIVVTLIYIIPFVLILINSVKSEAESSILSFHLPREVLFANYKDAFVQGNVLQGLGNGLFLSGVVTALTVLLCSLASFVIQRNRTLLTSGVYKYILAGMIAPFSFIPAIKLLQLLHMGSNLTGLIMVDMAAQIPFSILIYVGFCKGIPRELDEAAIIDGCGPFRLFFQVIFPLLLPVISTNIVLVFTSVWNDFGNVLFLMPNTKLWTMPIRVYSFQGFHTYNYALVSAFIVMSMLPVLVTYLLGQKYIISGMTAGAVKG